MKNNVVRIQRLWQVPSVAKQGKKPESATVGYLSFYKKATKGYTLVYSCYTIENGGESSSEVNKDKRILPGLYTPTLSRTTVPLPREYTPTGCLLNTDDPSFSKRRIFIHAGNYPQDTEGCILLQSTYDTTENPGYGRGSMRACKRFYDLLGDAKSTVIIIKDEPNDQHFVLLN